METTSTVTTPGRSLTTSTPQLGSVPPAARTVPGIPASGKDGGDVNSRGKRSKSGFVSRPSQKLKGSTVKKFLGVSSSSSSKGGSKLLLGQGGGGVAGDASGRRKLSVDTEGPSGNAGGQQIESFSRALTSFLFLFIKLPLFNLFSSNSDFTWSNLPVLFIYFLVNLCLRLPSFRFSLSSFLRIESGKRSGLLAGHLQQTPGLHCQHHAYTSLFLDRLCCCSRV